MPPAALPSRRLRPGQPPRPRQAAPAAALSAPRLRTACAPSHSMPRSASSAAPPGPPCSQPAFPKPRTSSPAERASRQASSAPAPAAVSPCSSAGQASVRPPGSSSARSPASYGSTRALRRRHPASSGRNRSSSSHGSACASQPPASRPPSPSACDMCPTTCPAHPAPGFSGRSRAPPPGRRPRLRCAAAPSSRHRRMHPWSNPERTRPPRAQMRPCRAYRLRTRPQSRTYSRPLRRCPAMWFRTIPCRRNTASGQSPPP